MPTLTDIGGASLNDQPPQEPRYVIERELARVKPKAAGVQPQQKESSPDRRGQTMALGDDARPGTPGTRGDVCPGCHGTGQVANKTCPNCQGRGRIIKAIGGA